MLTESLFHAQIAQTINQEPLIYVMPLKTWIGVNLLHLFICLMELFVQPKEHYAA